MSENQPGDNIAPTDQLIADHGNANQNPMDDDQPKGTVKYESYRKVVGVNKRQSEELAQLREKLNAKESAEKQAQEQQLAEQNRWKELHESKAKELEETQSKLHATNKMIEDAQKLRVLTRFAPIKSNYLDSNLFNLDKIVMNPETGEIDEHSAQKEAERIRTSYPDILESKAAPVLDSNAPIPNNVGSVNLDAYNRMTPAERLANADKVDGMPEWMKGGRSRLTKQ